MSLEPPVHGCANCGTPAPDVYCPACGQNTRERLPTFGQFMREATGRYVAYDGKFWKTLAGLLFRPGFLTREYLAGRRQRYIGPARLFLVSSLLLFATLRLATVAIDFDEAVQFESPKEPRTRVERAEKSDRNEKAERGARGEKREQAANDVGDGKNDKGDFVTLDDDLNLNLSELAGSAGILRKPIARFNSLSRAQKVEQIMVGALHYGPYAMFALLPAIAALLKLLYLGRGRRYPTRPRLYGEHLVFAAHNHAFVFVVGSLLAVLPASFVSGVLAVWMVVYLAWSTKVVYRGRWLGVVSRAFVLGFAYSILFGLVTVALVVAAVVLR